MRLRCFECQTTISTEVPDETVVRAIAICPECCEQAAEAVEVTAKFKKVIFANTWITVPTKVGEVHIGYSIIDRLQREHGSKMHSRATARRICEAHNASLQEFKKRKS